jgi:hypothetical protein
MSAPKDEPHVPMVGPFGETPDERRTRMAAIRRETDRLWARYELAEARREGFREGYAEVLLERLARKFGSLSAAVAERVQRAVKQGEDVRLRRWGARILVAETLDDVFSE